MLRNQSVRFTSLHGPFQHLPWGNTHMNAHTYIYTNHDLGHRKLVKCGHDTELEVNIFLLKASVISELSHAGMGQKQLLLMRQLLFQFQRNNKTFIGND